MPRRRSPPVSAEGLLHDITAQMEHFLKFLEVDLTPVLLGTSLTSEDPTIEDLISQGTNPRIWISRVQTILHWSSLAWEEEIWLQAQGLDRPSLGNRVQGVWSMPSFLRFLGLSHDHNARSSLQQGRKLRRFESKFGAGISLLMVSVMPSLRRLALGEEAKAIKLLATKYHNILLWAQRLGNLKTQYQLMLPRPEPANL